MQAWAILVDGARLADYLFEDRLLFIGLNKETALEQLQQLVANPDRLLSYQWELDYDEYTFWRPTDKDSIVNINLVKWLDGDNQYTDLYFRLVLLDMKEHSTLQTSIPYEFIQEYRDIVWECIGKGENRVD